MKQAAPVVRLSKLPPFQMAALKLLNISSAHDAAAEQFEQVFSSDPALSADLLLVANSAEFGLRSKIGTIRHAISFLGLDRVQSLASTIALGYYVRAMPRHAYMTSIWHHSIATAVIAEALGAIYKIPGLYTAGLTHDLGRLAMLFSMGAEYPAALDREFTDIEECNQLEKSLFAVTHCEAGTSLAAGWNFPAPLVRCMGEHHKPNLSEKDGPLFVVQVACQLADRLNFPEVRRADLQNSIVWPEHLQGRAELGPEPLTELIKKHLALVS
jgi:HD-like signal output (HDOD) protein